MALRGRASEGEEPGSAWLTPRGAPAGIHAHRMIRALVRLGWVVLRTSGSHHVLARAGRARIVVPVHRGTALKEGLVRGILNDAGVSEVEFFSVY